MTLPGPAPTCSEGGLCLRGRAAWWRVRRGVLSSVTVPAELKAVKSVIANPLPAQLTDSHDHVIRWAFPLRATVRISLALVSVVWAHLQCVSVCTSVCTQPCYVAQAGLGPSNSGIIKCTLPHPILIFNRESLQLYCTRSFALKYNQNLPRIVWFNKTTFTLRWTKANWPIYNRRVFLSITFLSMILQSKSICYHRTNKSVLYRKEHLGLTSVRNIFPRNIPDLWKML